MTVRRRKVWGWGYEGEGLTPQERDALGAALAARLGGEALSWEEPPRPQDIDLPPPKVSPPDALAGVITDDPHERAAHAYGKSYRDLVRSLRGDFSRPPDLVALPSTEEKVRALLEWCAESQVAAIPYGGGSSVVGGVEPDVGDGYRGAVTIDLRRLSGVPEVDEVSWAAKVLAGTLGPDLEDALRPHGLTLRHFPQSFEQSTVGGWIATRSGGHHATLRTHIDDAVESLRLVTPRGVVETRRLPGSGAGPSPDRLFIGSEGALGVITEAWVRVHARPRHRASGRVLFGSFEEGAEAVRALAQSGLHPSNCRLLDPTEALVAGAGDGERAVLLVGFESPEHRVDGPMVGALECCEDHGGDVVEERVRSSTDDEASAPRPAAEDAWRRTFLWAPHLRDAMVAMGLITETFETAVTWERFPALHDAVTSAVRTAMEEVGAGRGWVSARFTHVYPDGPAPYYTVVAPGRRGAELEQWEAIKAAASEAILGAGGTITHHHAVGRDHRPWYDRQRPSLYAEALRAAKEALDPAWVCNPGVLLDRG